MVYPINCKIMRKFGYIPPVDEDFEAPVYDNSVDPGNPGYEPSVFDHCMHDTLPDGSFIQVDITSILLAQEKYRHLLGDNVMQELINSVHPTPSTLQDSMTDEQRFDAIISRHCQTVSERQAVLSELASRSVEMKSFIESMASESASAGTSDSSASASAAS